MVNAKVIGVVMLLALGIPQSYSEDVLYEPPDPVEDDAPAPASDGEQNLGKENVPQLEQDPSLHLDENIEASDNLSVTFTEQNSAQSLDPSSVSSRQNEGLGNPFILPYTRQSGSAADLLHLIQRSRSLPSPSEISGTFYTLNILPPDLDKSYEPEGVQVNPNQSQEPSHQPPELSGYSLSQGSEGQGVKNAENNEHSNDTIQQKEIQSLSNADSEVLEQHREVSQDLPDLDEQKSSASRKRELDISTSLVDQDFGALGETQIKTQEDNTPKKIGNSQDPTSEVPTIPALHKPVDYIEEIYLTSDWPIALEISQPVAISTISDSVQRPQEQDRTQESDTLQISGITSSLPIPTQANLGTDIVNNVAEKFVHLSEELQTAHQPETQGELSSFEHLHLQPTPLVATVYKDTESTIQNLSSLAEIPLNSDTTRHIGEKLTGIVSDNHNNESQQSAVIYTNQKELADSKLVTLDLSHLSSEGHSLFVEVLPLDTELQRAGGTSPTSQISADTESNYNNHSIQLPQNTVSSSIQRDQVIHAATEIPVELKSVSPVNTGNQLPSPTGSSNKVYSVTPQQRDHLPPSPAAKEITEATLIPSSATIRHETNAQDHSIDKGQLSTRVPESLQGQLPTRVPESSQGQLSTHVPESSQGQLPTRVPESSQGQLPTRVPESSQGQLPTRVPESSQGQLPTRVPESSQGQLPTRVPESSQEPNLDSNDKFHHRDLSIEGSALSGAYETEISKVSTSRHPQEGTAARQPRRSRGGLTPLFTPPETREDFKDALPHPSAEEKKVSKPYQFSYNVKDPSKGADFGHQEDSDGKTVKGQYFVVLPDGRKQTVQYQADHVNGYQSEVAYHPQDVPSGGIIRGDAFSLEHIFTRGNNNNLLDLGSNNNVNNQYQQEVLQNNDVLNQGIATDYQHIPNDEVLNQHQDVGSIGINDLSLQLPEQPFQVSNDQYQSPVDNQFEQPSPGNHHGLITDYDNFEQSDFDDQFYEQDIFDQPVPHSETNQYQSLNGGPNFQPDFGGGQFPLPNNGDQFHPVEEDQFQNNNQFLQHGKIRNDDNVQPSVHFSHQPIDDGDQHFADGNQNFPDGDNQYQLVSNGDQPFPIAEGNQHQFRDNGNQDQPSVASQYQETNGNDQFTLQNEGNPFNFLDGSDHLQVNGDFGQFPHSSENEPAQYAHSEPLNAQSGNVPLIAVAHDSEFHSPIHGNQAQPPALNEESFGSQSRSDPVESQIIAVPLPSRTFDLQTQPFLSLTVIPTTEDHDFNPGYNSNEYESSIESSYDQTQIQNELKSISSENFPQRRDVHNQEEATIQVVPSIDHQSNITFNDSQDEYDGFHEYDGSENPQELIETESNQQFEDEISPNDDFSSESFQTEEILPENVEPNSFQSEGLVHNIPEALEDEKLYSESSDS